MQAPDKSHYRLRETKKQCCTYAAVAVEKTLAESDIF